MESEILQIATGQGIWAVLFVGLFFYVLQENSKREENFQEIILALTEKLDTLESIKKDLIEVKEGLSSFLK